MLKSREKAFCMMGGIALILLLVVRLVSVYYSASLIDIRIISATGDLVLHHISPYVDSPEYSAYQFPALPIQSPSMTAIIMPFLVLPQKVLFALLFTLNIGSVALLLYLVLRKFHIFQGCGVFALNYTNLAIWLISALCLMSSPVLTMLRHGQLIGITTLLIALVFLFPDANKRNIIYLGIAASIKYSLLTLFAPILILQRRWLICFAGFFLFLILVLLPGFWLNGPIDSFREYLALLLRDVQGGTNSYAHGSSFCMVQFDFWRQDLFNIAGKAALLIGFLLMLLRASRLRGNHRWILDVPRELTLPEFAFLTSALLCISYHRNYDGAMFMPFLAALCAQDVLARNWKTGVVNGMFMLFWAYPMMAMYSLSNAIGRLLSPLETLVYFSDYLQWETIFPLSNIVLFVMAWWFFALTFRHESDRSSLAAAPSQPGHPLT